MKTQKSIIIVVHFDGDFALLVGASIFSTVLTIVPESTYKNKAAKINYFSDDLYHNFINNTRLNDDLYRILFIILVAHLILKEDMTI